MNNQINECEPDGYLIKDWCKRVGISRSMFYILPSEVKPRLVKIGRRVVVFEKPKDWLLRMAKANGVTVEELRN